jgi:hypothetical protein
LTEENDMIGHIAYSLYKSNKIKEFIEDFKVKMRKFRAETTLKLSTGHLKQQFQHCVFKQNKYFLNLLNNITGKYR